MPRKPQESLTARFTKDRFTQTVLSRKQGDVDARKGSAWPIVDAGGTNSAATVGVHAMVTEEDEARYGVKKLGGIDSEEVRIVCRD